MSTYPRHIGKYELHQRLGQGGMAEVWKALDPHLERYVAIKILHANLQNDSDFIKRFEREARVVASLRHPNIVQIHDFQVARSSEESNSTAYMVMEYVEGQTLTEYIHKTSYQGNFPPATEIIHLFSSISKAIDYAHQRGMIHRDIKPANILLDKRNPSPYQMGEPILTDFGIVKLLGTSTATLSGAWMGTPSYISPEQAQGYPGNECSDIYSLGIILYEVCTGVRPFQGETPLAVLWHHINSVPPSPSFVNPHISLALSDVILRGLAKDPARRFQSASEMAEALVWAFGSHPQISMYQSEGRNETASMSPTHSNPSTEATPSSLYLPTPGYIPPLPSTVLSTPKFAAQTPSNNEQNVLMTPASDPSIKNPSQNSATTKEAPLDTVLLPPSRLHKLWRGKISLLVIFLCILVVSSSIGTFYFLQNRSNSTPLGDQIVGQAVFKSSGQLSVSSSRGLYDRLQIHLSNIQAAAPGKSYYGWLLNEASTIPAVCPISSTTPFLFIGKLTVDHGNIDFPYPGDPQHDNLLGIISSLLITEEDANTVPRTPSRDQSTWRYSAKLPQESNAQAADGSSALDNLRCLIYEQPGLVDQGIHGGVEPRFFQNIQQVLNLSRDASSALASNDTHSIHRNILLILEYIDGLSYFMNDVPHELPPLPTDTSARVGLIDLQGHSSFDAYVDPMSQRLTNIYSDPNATSRMHQLADQAGQVVSKEGFWLQQVHTYAMLPATKNTLNSMVTNAQYAYDGAVQIDNDIQGLATLEITPIKS